MVVEDWSSKQDITRYSNPKVGRKKSGKALENWFHIVVGNSVHDFHSGVYSLSTFGEAMFLHGGYVGGYRLSFVNLNKATMHLFPLRWF